MFFLVRVEVRNLEYFFSNPAVSASSRGKASVFSTLVSLLIQTSILFLLFLSLLVGGLATSGGQKVGRLQYKIRRRFFDRVVIGVLGK